MQALFFNLSACIVFLFMLCYTRAPLRVAQFLPMWRVRSVLCLLLACAMHCVTVLLCKYCAIACCMCLLSCLLTKRCCVCMCVLLCCQCCYVLVIAYCVVHCKHLFYFILCLQCCLFCVSTLLVCCAAHSKRAHDPLCMCVVLLCYKTVALFC